MRNGERFRRERKENYNKREDKKEKKEMREVDVHACLCNKLSLGIYENEAAILKCISALSEACTCV